MLSVTASAAPKTNVLVVEDEPFTRIVAAEALLDAGFSVFEVTNAYEAMQTLCGGSTVDAVLTDIEMPGAMDGVGLATAVRGRWPHIAILVTSGRVKPEPDELPAGTGFLSKPYILSEVVACIAEMVGSPAARRLCLSRPQ